MMSIILLCIMYVLALASEERTRQMKVHTFRTPAPSSASQDLERTLKNKREVSAVIIIFLYIIFHYSLMNIKFRFI